MAHTSGHTPIKWSRGTSIQPFGDEFRGVQIFHPFLNERELPNSEAIKQRLQPEGSYTISINTGNEQMDARDEEQHD